jgi:hypothetical protein
MKNQSLNRYRVFGYRAVPPIKGPSVPDRNIGNLYSGTEGTGAPIAQARIRFLDTKMETKGAHGQASNANHERGMREANLSSTTKKKPRASKYSRGPGVGKSNLPIS